MVTFSPDAIFHLAAQADVRKAVEDPVHDAKVNVLGTINSLECAREAGARLIFAATGGAAYGEGEGRRVPFVETDAGRPGDPVRGEQDRRRALRGHVSTSARGRRRSRCASATSTDRARIRTAKQESWRSSAGGCSAASR